MKFKCLNMTYEIIEVPEEELKEIYIKEHPDEKKNNIYYIFGNTNYIEHIIRISKELNEEEKIRTLKHELCHCWMWNTANSNQSEYDEEHICEIVASSNDFINEVVNEYIKIKQLNLYECDSEKNIGCKKKSCYESGGPCYLTTNKEYSKQ